MTRSALILGNALLFRAIGYVFPLLSIPLYSHWLGSKAYGQLGLVLTFCTLLQAVCEYGHTVGGGGRLARAPSHEAARLVSASIYSQKLVLLGVSFLAGSIYFFCLKAGVGIMAAFFAAFFMIVAPDALTPIWVYHGTSAVPRYAKLQFLSRLVTLVPGLLLLWVVPVPAVGAVATGLPFAALLFSAVRGVRPLLALPFGTGATLAGTLRALVTELPFSIGALAATSLAPLAMQIAHFFDRDGDLGAVYLAIALWIALRQLYMLPHQANYGRAAQAGSSGPGAGPERMAFAVATTTATVMVLIASVIPGAVYALVFGPKYASVATLLPRMLLSGIPFSIAYGIVLNRIAARGMAFEFSSSYVVAAVAFVAVFIPGRYVWPVDISLPVAMVAADCSFLLCSWFFLSRRTAPLCAP